MTMLLLVLVTAIDYSKKEIVRGYFLIQSSVTLLWLVCRFLDYTMIPFVYVNIYNLFLLTTQYSMRSENVRAIYRVMDREE